MSHPKVGNSYAPIDSQLSNTPDRASRIGDRIEVTEFVGNPIELGDSALVPILEGCSSVDVCCIAL